MARQQNRGVKKGVPGQPGTAHRHAATGRSNREEVRPPPGSPGSARHHDGKKHQPTGEPKVKLPEPSEILEPMDTDVSTGRAHATRTDSDMRDGDSGHGNPGEGGIEGVTTDNDVG